MECPHCKANLSDIEVRTTADQVVHVSECQNCGGHELEPGLVHLLAANTTQNLDSILPKSDSVPTHHPVCTHCQQTMSLIKDDSVPQTVTVFHCPNNHSEFYPSGQLHLLKRAQSVKIEFANLWGIPLHKIAKLALPLAIVFSLVTLGPQAINLLNTNQEVRIQAGEPISTPRINQISDTQVIITFTSQDEDSYTLNITSPVTHTFSNTQSTDQHVFSLTELEPSTLYEYYLSPNSNEDLLHGPFFFDTTTQ
jgi:hypothetical protein